MTDHIDRAYAETRLTREEERGRECHRAGCDSPVDDSQQCSTCGVWFCWKHLFDGFCDRCYCIDEAAGRLIERQRPGGMRRIVLTEKELDALLALVCIAEAGQENEGDYQDFDYRSMDSASKKLDALLQRKQGK